MAEERTIAFADLSGFTALTEAHGDETGAAIACRFYDMTRSLLRNGATLVKTIGDAVMIAAPDPDTGAAIILELQTMTDSTPNFPRIRAGLHVGPACEVEHDYFGASVNVAARVAAYARAGQVLCTAAVADRIAASSLCKVSRIGPIPLRNVHDPVVIYELHNPAVVAAAAHVDPVCRMHVSLDSAVAWVKSGSTEYYFCSFACLHTFVLEQAASG
ncbi:MAG TPA: adenylate/guanylate cyclase domain-containing protein, partial [Rhodothermia bacterium]|nr:adenylate/guanylate cyclase domain-containing protein [Rhodothermia bacterium]